MRVLLSLAFGAALLLQACISTSVADCGQSESCFISQLSKCTATKAVVSSLELPVGPGLFNQPNNAAQVFSFQIPQTYHVEIRGGTQEACKVFTRLEQVDPAVYFVNGTQVGTITELKNVTDAIYTAFASRKGEERECTMPVSVMTGTDMKGYSPEMIMSACTFKRA
ncbi:hypothetical protein HYS54_03630 [Candidatus Micrarchaeota archaeon]|nr:hypothetical protein [Candidatus Micrarchaeota archaeon]